MALPRVPIKFFVGVEFLSLVNQLPHNQKHRAQGPYDSYGLSGLDFFCGECRLYVFCCGTGRDQCPKNQIE